MRIFLLSEGVKLTKPPPVGWLAVRDCVEEFEDLRRCEVREEVVEMCWHGWALWRRRVKCGWGEREGERDEERGFAGVVPMGIPGVVGVNRDV